MASGQDRENLRKEMLTAQKEQKILFEKRDLLLSNIPQNQKEALKITHKIASLQDFIVSAEKALKRGD